LEAARPAYNGGDISLVEGATMTSFLRTAALLTAFFSLSKAIADEADKAAAERGAKAVRGQPPMNPSLWSLKAIDDIWKQWGVKEKPADLAKAIRERYGLLEAAYPNNGLPMGLHMSSGLFGKGAINDCLLCHAGRVAGQTIIGAGNSSLDLQSLFDDLTESAKLPFRVPVQVAYARGTIDPINPVTYLMEFRDPVTLKVLDAPRQLGYSKDVASDPPAWWLLKRKQTRNWTGGVKVNSIRVDMANLLTPLNTPEHIKSHEKTFADIHAFIMNNVEAPKYPFAIDAARAEQGRVLFNETCARCHGTYGPGGKYPNKIVPIETVGTDRRLIEAQTPRLLQLFNESWFSKEKGPDGTWYQVDVTPGYQAPPLDGVWATAPYLHNASVPTLYHVLNSKARPRYWTRSYGSEREDYDAEMVGWKTMALDAPPAPYMSPWERRRIYDTTLPGRSNTGHTFGDEFTEEQRRAVIEYLKTL
jgi:hypothetical protein